MVLKFHFLLEDTKRAVTHNPGYCPQRSKETLLLRDKDLWPYCGLNALLKKTSISWVCSYTLNLKNSSRPRT